MRSASIVMSIWVMYKTRFRAGLTTWIILLILLISFAIYWLYDSFMYDKDLESDHIRETGLAWEVVE